MIHDMPSPNDAKPGARADVRMTIGEHLDDLRRCLIRCMFALVIACLACIWPAKMLLWLIARPLVLTLQAHDQQDSFLQTSPVEGILVYVKVILVFGLIISAPYIILQIWKFVAIGLYETEKKWVFKLVPASVGLFAAGVAFMYIFVLLVCLNFLVGFSDWLSMPDFSPTPVENALLGGEAEETPTTQPAFEDMLQIPVLAEDPDFEPEKNAELDPVNPAFDPNDPPIGLTWFNSNENKLKVFGRDQVYSVQMRRDEKRAMMTTHFKIGEYLTFVLVLTVAFGLAFQMPLVVVFLVRSGIVPIQTLRTYRKMVYLLVVIIAGAIAPPDLLSHLMLSGPMIGLFEIGLLVAGRNTKAAAAAG